MGVWNIPVDESQPSIVHGLLSFAFIAVWIISLVKVLQASVVQALSSSTETNVCVIKPFEESHSSIVQTLPSSTFTKLLKIISHKNSFRQYD